MEWECGDWATCQSDGTQSRVCTYLGNCPVGYADNNVPDLTQDCEYIIIPAPVDNVTTPVVDPTDNQTTPYMGGLTGFIIANPGTAAGIVSALIIIIGAVYYSLRKNKKVGEGKLLSKPSKLKGGHI